MLETSARNVLNLKMVKTKKLLYVREVQREHRELYRERKIGIEIERLWERYVER